MSSVASAMSELPATKSFLTPIKIDMNFDTKNDWFDDYANPTERELKRWMEDPDSFEPTQDWDLIVGRAGNLNALVRLSRSKGPQRDMIVHYLYVATAEAFNHARDVITVRQIQ